MDFKSRKKTNIMLKKGVFIVLALVVCFAAYIFYAKSTNKEVEKDKEIPLKISKNTDKLNQSLDATLNAYYTLHDGLVRWAPVDSIGQMADSLSKLAAAVPYTEIKADSLLIQTAQSYGKSIQDGCASIIKDTAISGQRRDFYTTTEALYNLLRTVQYDRKTIYHIKCPMAFNGDEEGFWLSDSSKIINPYFGTKDPTYHSGMLHCGSVEDSISFARL
jgi:hypothetical protein